MPQFEFTSVVGPSPGAAERARQEAKSNFLENILAQLGQAADRPVLQEVRDTGIVSATGGELLEWVGAARSFLRRAGLQKGDRCALLAHNSMRWAALDLALMAEGIIVVPLYARQAPAELAAMVRDAQVSLICCGDATLSSPLAKAWPEAPRRVLLDEVFAARCPPVDRARPPAPLHDTDPVTIIYTSGTSGEPKGVVLTAGNLDHMLACTTARLDALVGATRRPDRVFHYLPFCFAGSWILLLSCLVRSSVLTLSTDLSKLAEEMRLAEPDYFLNVPALLERLRAGIEEQLRQHGGAVQALFERGGAAWLGRRNGQSRGLDRAWLWLAQRTVFAVIRRRLGRNLKALICGSAPLAVDTQLFFAMLGVPVLQVYGLTETTAICTMDQPGAVEPGFVGPAIPGIAMKLGLDDEILVRGPNIFLGYWHRPDETAKVLAGGWFHTGDQGEVNGTGNWRIVGRLKDLIVLNSGHKVAPEPLETELVRRLPGAQQVMLLGNRQSYLTAIITGQLVRDAVERELRALNAQLPHYKQVRGFHLAPEPFSIQNGLLTANGKLRRDAIAARFAAEIETLYGRATA